ncbi:MAG: hypothetical protein ISR58_17345 [Anaerolineales bacterium]|nr:hypothetical protein [Chloroflexota bacterium]MBL6982942.1 hypothetical protein [Anaerolineales bacterium]
MFSSRKSIRNLALLFSALVMAAVTYGFAASNTVPAHKAGDGLGAVTGFTVSNIEYDLNATTPSNVDAVEFDLDVAATDVLIETGGQIFSFDNGDCSFSGTPAVHVTCDTSGSGLTVTAIASLRVISAATAGLK